MPSKLEVEGPGERSKILSMTVAKMKKSAINEKMAALSSISSPFKKTANLDPFDASLNDRVTDLRTSVEYIEPNFEHSDRDLPPPLLIFGGNEIVKAKKQRTVTKSLDLSSPAKKVMLKPTSTPKKTPAVVTVQNQINLLKEAINKKKVSAEEKIKES